MESKRSVPVFSSLPVVPPLLGVPVVDSVAGENHRPLVGIEARDQRFLKELSDWIGVELSQVDDQRHTPWQRYTIYKEVFSKVCQQLLLLTLWAGCLLAQHFVHISSA